MPELPDIAIYLEALRTLIGRGRLEGVQLSSPFLLRTVAPSPDEAVGLGVRAVRRIGKRIVLEVDSEILADHARSRLLKKDWPRSIDEL